MLPGTIITGDTALKLATRYAPLLKQYWRDLLYDSVIGVCMGQVVLEFSNKPKVYFKVSLHRFRDGSTFFVINYHFFHRKDWTASPLKLLQNLDSHEFDFEGIALYIRKVGSYLYNPELLVTRAHSHFDYDWYPMTLDGRVSVWIESQGHGIHPIDHNVPCRFCSHQVMKDGEENAIEYDRYELVNLHEPQTAAWFDQTVYPTFEKYGVDPPQKLNHHHIRRKLGHETDGDIYLNPERFLVNSIALGLTRPPARFQVELDPFSVR